MSEMEARSARLMDGAAAAAVIAAGIGVFVLGLVTSLAEMIDDFREWLAWNDEVGPLSGKTSLGLLAWAVTWPVLHVFLYRRDGLVPAALVVFAVLTAIGSVLMFPPVYERLAG